MVRVLMLISALVAGTGVFIITELPIRWVPNVEADAKLNPSQYSEALSRLKRQADLEIGVPYAKEPKQCRLVGFGSKPCGGPWTYLIYSTAITDESRLKRLVAEYNQVDRLRNEEQQWLSTCDVTPAPKIEIRNGICNAVDQLKPNLQ